MWPFDKKNAGTFNGAAGQSSSTWSSAADSIEDTAPDADFHTVLLHYGYDGATADRIVDIFQNINLPLPQSEKEYLPGTEGELVFLNRYGVVLRIENKMRIADNDWTDRVPDSPWILKPLAEIDAGGAIVTLCPGCYVGRLEEDVRFLKRMLRREKINFWDARTDNAGLRPFKTRGFRAGVPVVIDRGAVNALTAGVFPIMQALPPPGAAEIAKAERAAAAADAALYAPLRHAFAAAWPGASGPADAVKMRAFWDLCRQHVREGKLVAGWDLSKHAALKTQKAGKRARAYDLRLRDAEKGTGRPPPPAAPQ